MVYYFTAAWCGPCKMFKPIVQEVSSELEIGIVYVDVDQQRDMAMKYGVTSVPTIMIENNGSVLYRNSGVISKSQLKQALSQFR